MANVEWQIEGVELANCNCAYGCPCQFNALPTHGNCRAMTAFKIERGTFGDVKLDGLCIVMMASWPGPIHEGKGTWQSVIDERADARQRAALEAISLGRETDPGGSIFQIFSTTVTTVLETAYRPIQFTMDLEAGTGSLSVAGIIETTVEPIRNPMTGARHRARVTLPQGFEYTEAEYVSGNTATQGKVALNFTGTHGHLAPIHFSTHGVVR